MTASTVMLSVRIPPSTRDNFQAALKERGTTPTDYIRDAIATVLKDWVPVPEKCDYAKLASSYLSGELPSTPILHLLAEHPVPLVTKIEEALERTPPGVIDAWLVNKAFAVALHNMSNAYVELNEKHQRLKKAVEMVQEVMND